tara:strand:- start:879 stop:1655 length:777 start_codon:yes stop_codon:yes gene_type:complete
MSQCGTIPEFSLDPESDLSAVDLSYEEQEIGEVLGQTLTANLPSGASLNPEFIETLYSQFTDYLQSPDIKNYADCRIDEAKGDLDLNRLEEFGDQGERLMETAENLMDNADTLKNESKEITLTSLNDIESTVENYRFTISLVLTILTFLVILIFINMMQRLIPKNGIAALGLIIMLILIFSVTYLIFESLYNNIILKPFIEKSNLIKGYLNPSPSPSQNPNDKSEENDWIWIWIYLVIDIILIGVIVLGLIIVNIYLN